MALSHPIVPETKPATELIDGKLVQKMSPYGLHARVQLAIGAASRQWAEDRGCGRVGTEWDDDLTPPGGRTNRLVPDVAYLAYDRVGYEDEAAAQTPIVAPNVAVEILSDGHTVANSARRIEIFLACGTELIVIVDPRAERGWLIDATGTTELERDGTIEHPALPGFSLPLRACFERTPPPGYGSTL